MKKQSYVVWGVVLVALLQSRVPVQAVTIVAAEDTYVTEHSGLGGTSSTHGSELNLFDIAVIGFRSTPLVKFDLTPFANTAVEGDALFEVYLNSSSGMAPLTHTTEIREQLSSWQEGSVCWDTLPGPRGSLGDVLDVRDVRFDQDQGLGPRYVSWSLPGAVIQKWIDDPGSNNGLAFRTTTLIRDLVYYSSEAATGYQPRLTFLPEPSSACLLAFGGLVLLRRRRSA